MDSIIFSVICTDACLSLWGLKFSYWHAVVKPYGYFSRPLCCMRTRMKRWSTPLEKWTQPPSRWKGSPCRTTSSPCGLAHTSIIGSWANLHIQIVVVVVLCSSCRLCDWLAGWLTDQLLVPTRSQSLSSRNLDRHYYHHHLHITTSTKNVPSSINNITRKLSTRPPLLLRH